MKKMESHMIYSDILSHSSSEESESVNSSSTGDSGVFCVVSSTIQRRILCFLCWAVSSGSQGSVQLWGCAVGCDPGHVGHEPDCSPELAAFLQHHSLLKCVLYSSPQPKPQVCSHLSDCSLQMSLGGEMNTFGGESFLQDET